MSAAESATGLGDFRVLQSWTKNTDAWTDAVREGKIASRVAVTDQAIVRQVLQLSPRSVLDLGCGEGWLARVLASSGIDAHGVDAIPSLIDAARQAGGAEYSLLSYENLAAGMAGSCFDAVVCNFSLIGKESVDAVFRAVPGLLTPGGALVVQTLHPVIACGDLPYADGWREGSWAGFGPEFTDPSPWYFRTMGSWVGLFAKAGLRLDSLLEPLNPATGRPASVIFTAGIPH